MFRDVVAAGASQFLWHGVESMKQCTLPDRGIGRDTERRRKGIPREGVGEEVKARELARERGKGGRVGGGWAEREEGGDPTFPLWAPNASLYASSGSLTAPPCLYLDQGEAKRIRWTKPGEGRGVSFTLR